MLKNDSNVRFLRKEVFVEGRGGAELDLGDGRGELREDDLDVLGGDDVARGSKDNVIARINCQKIIKEMVGMETILN